MNLFKFKRNLIKKKNSLKKSKKDLFIKIDYPFKKNPLTLWWFFPLVILNFFIVNLALILPPCFLQKLLLRLIGVKIGKNAGISIGFKVDYWFPDLIEIHDNVIIGSHVTIYTHDITKSRIKLGKVIIKKDSLIGANSIIGSGVIIEKNCKISLGSIITAETLPNNIYKGHH